MDLTLKPLIDAMQALLLASDELEQDAPSPEKLSHIIINGLFRPSDNEQLAYWFARFLSIRSALWEVIAESIQRSSRPVKALSTTQEWRIFVIGYSAACLLIRNDRFLLFQVACHSVIQRKLNEAFAEYGIPRKQYTNVYSSYVSRRDALKIYTAMTCAKQNRNRLDALVSDDTVGMLAGRLDEFESWLDPSRRNYVFWFFNYLSHKWRRKGVVAVSASFAGVMERFGRTASELKLPTAKRMTPVIRDNLAQLLEPGDVLLTRHDNALTNLFLPGFWPHAALYIGDSVYRDQSQMSLPATIHDRWSGEITVLEALKDGVRFRPLHETLSVDKVLVLRPRLSREQITEGIRRAVQHEGKLYNFDFDFFTADRLVCTEVIYRAYDGLGDMKFPLIERAGRHTLSAEDLLRYGQTSGTFSVVAGFGFAGAEASVVVGADAAALVASIGVS